MNHLSTRPMGERDGANSSLPAGTLLGRYVVLQDLGAGGEGRVYLAYDPVLERRVAVKVLRAKAAAYATLLREARVLAKLDHPNVVSIHDVAGDGEQPFMAMELMQGEAFLEFAARARPDELLAALTDIADAIAAAHDAELVHGDVKPSNILRSASGLTKLSDFGLARASSSGSGASSTSPAGTPAYLAPEQLEGEPCSPATDQYAFCLTAYVAFHGDLPWSTDSIDASQPGLGGSTNLEIAPVDRDARARRSVPRWTARGVPATVARAFIRGLQLDPTDRWTDMRALLAQLRHAPRRRKMLRTATIFGSFALSAAAVMVTTSDDPPCTHATTSMDETWTAEAREQVRTQLHRGPAFAQAHALVDRRLGDFAEGWSEMSRESCEATRVHETQSDALLDRRQECLSDALADFKATLEVLSKAPNEDAADELVQTAHHVVGRLPSLAPCADVERLQRRVPLPDNPDAEARIAEATEALARVKAQRSAGRYAEAQELLESWEPTITELNYAPLLVELDDEKHRIFDNASDWEQADVSARQSLERALSIGDLDAALRLSTSLTMIHGARNRDTDLAMRYREIARGLVDRDGVEVSDRAAYLRAFANTSALAGNYDEAVPVLEQAVEISRSGDVTPENLARLINDLAVAYQDNGQLDDAIAAYKEALELRREALGEGHPEVARALHNLSGGYSRAERLQEAEQASRDALEILRGAFPADHGDVAYAELGLANQLLGQMRYAEAIPLYETALRSLKTRVGEDHPHIAVVESSLGGALVGTERQEEGLALLRSAIARSERSLGAEHPRLVDFHGNYGTTLVSLERYDEAEEHLRRAVTLGRATMGELHMNTVRVAYRLAELYRRKQQWTKSLELVEPLLEQLAAKGDAIPAQKMRLRDNAAASLYELGENRDALPLLRQSLEAFGRGEVTEPYYKATTQLRMAKVLWALGGSKRSEEARSMAQQARDGFEAIGEATMVQRVQTLLAEHR